MTKLTRRWRTRLLIFGIWTALGVFVAVHSYVLAQSAIKARLDLPKEAVTITWFPFDRRHWKSSLAVHLLACMAVVVAQAATAALANEWLRQGIPKPSLSRAVMQLFIVGRLLQNVLFYWAIFGVSQSLDYYRKFRDRELRASLLQAQLAQAQLQVLKMQLHPHFLFNTLNAISALMHQDVELADRMIARLGELLRATLENANLQEVTLRQELDFIQPYLEIEKARLGPRLQVQFRIDEQTLDGLVPNMLLQPLVENAIRHGIAPRVEPGHIEITSQRDNGTLKLKIQDDGPGLRLNPPPRPSTGLGLANTRARLDQLYGTTGDIELRNGSPGLEVLVTIPFHESVKETAPTSAENAGSALEPGTVGSGLVPRR